jgi:hypothetical protein
MTIKFTKEDAQTCFTCDIHQPSFRFISLDLVPGKDRALVPTRVVTLLCKDCLRLALDDFHESLKQCEIPLEEGETEDHFFTRQIGVLVVPISLSYEEARLLGSELQTDGLESVVS